MGKATYCAERLRETENAEIKIPLAVRLLGLGARMSFSFVLSLFSLFFGEAVE